MIKIFNTMSGKLEDFVTVKENEAGMYVCGPTVYNYVHIGNSRPIIFFDTVRRYLEYRGYKVKFVQNFTDIDDKIITKANEEGVTIKEITDRYIKAYFEDTKTLNVKEGTIRPKATEYVERMVNFVKKLEEKGFAYSADGDVYFDITKLQDYGKLSGKNIEELDAGNRIDINSRKKNPMDFVLWKGAKPGEPKWESPWGDGRPGWHLECSVMSMNEIGETIDIHGGGEDLIFPHHENEIAQSEAVSGKQFVKYWMHNRFLNINGEKMSKSLGNFSMLRDVVSKYEGRVLRFFILTAHYRKPIEFSDVEMEMAKSGLTRIDNALKRIYERAAEAPADILNDEETIISEIIENMKEKFMAGMDEDFNTPIAIGAIFEAVKELNIISGNEKLTKQALEKLVDAAKTIETLMENVLGIEKLKEEQLDNGIAKELIDYLVELRWNAKKDKNWALADSVRNKLTELGIKLEDKKDKTLWSL